MKHTKKFLSKNKWEILFFSFGIFVIIRLFGINLSQLPGDMGDTRFNLYLLEHFYQWIHHPNTNYWQANFYYSYPNTITFSDTLLGSAPIYAFFRLLGVSKESAFQGWYLAGFLFNTVSADYVLRKFKLHPAAAAFGAFIFSFSLPVLTQETHAQLLYRFCVPLAVYYFWLFTQKPVFFSGLAVIFFVVWQLYLTIYIGYFLVLILGFFIMITPWFIDNKPTFRNRVCFWFSAVKQAWIKSSTKEKIFTGVGLTLCLGLFLILILPYVQTANQYHFTRPSDEIKSMLPRWQSYFLADRSLFWAPISNKIAGIPLRHEHQLFPGIAVLLLLIPGFFIKLPSPYRKFVTVNLVVFVILVMITLNINGFSIYQFLINLPGINSIRAVTRIQLVLVWPLSVFCGFCLDFFIQKKSLITNLLSILVIFLFFAEILTFKSITFSKSDSQIRVAVLREEIKQSIDPSINDPVILVGSDPNQPWYVSELDAMLATQDLGVATLNGYSGNLLHGFSPVTTCAEIPLRIQRYMRFAEITDPAFYLDMMQRVIPIHLNDCDPNWWKEPPL